MTMRPTETSHAVEAVRTSAIPLTPDGDHDALVERIGEASLVLIGEASHGTHEFYRERARITQQLICDKGFEAVAVEGDWPDAYRINRFVRGLDGDESAVDALRGFERFPTWMWRNTDVCDFVDWQRAHNARLPADRRTGFYGLDLYSLGRSVEAVLRHLEKTDPHSAQAARDRYACFDRFGDDGQLYGLMTGVRGARSCEQAVLAMLAELRERAGGAAAAGRMSLEEAFDAEQNARLVKNAEAYYRAMYLSDVSSWNQRDRHMAETVDELQRHLGRGGGAPKIVVWAHNSHLGDARATEMGERRGELNLGQLLRERHGDDVFIIGFSTHRGSVTAASNWDSPAERKDVRPSLPESHEHVLHATGIERFLLPLCDGGPATEALRQPRLERAIGVIYRPETERQSHYFSARMSDQFDAVIHIDVTTAVEALPCADDAVPAEGEPPETFPSGI